MEFLLPWFLGLGSRWGGIGGPAVQVDSCEPNFLPSFGKFPALKTAEARNGANNNPAMHKAINPPQTSKGGSTMPTPFGPRHSTIQ